MHHGFAAKSHAVIRSRRWVGLSPRYLHNIGNCAIGCPYCMDGSPMLDLPPLVMPPEEKQVRDASWLVDPLSEWE